MLKFVRFYNILKTYWPIFFITITFSNYTLVSYFYGQYGVDIFDYMDISEITFELIFTFAESQVILYPVIFYALFSAIIISKEANSKKIKFVIRFLIILLSIFIAYVIFLSTFSLYYILTKNFYWIAFFPVYVLFIFWYIRGDSYKRNPIIFGILIWGLLCLYSLALKDENTILSRADSGTYLFKENGSVKVDFNTFLLRKTNKYFIFHSIKRKTNLIIPVEDFKSASLTPI